MCLRGSTSTAVSMLDAFVIKNETWQGYEGSADGELS